MHGDDEGDLGEAAEAAGEEAVEHALRDEEALHGGTDVLHALVDSGDHASLLSAPLTFSGVTEDASDDDSSEVSHLSAADAAGTAESKRPDESGEEEADLGHGQDGVHDGVKGENDGPLGVGDFQASGLALAVRDHIGVAGVE